MVCRRATRCGQPLGMVRGEKSSGLKVVTDPTARYEVTGANQIGEAPVLGTSKRSVPKETGHNAPATQVTLEKEGASTIAIAENQSAQCDSTKIVPGCWASYRCPFRPAFRAIRRTRTKGVASGSMSCAILGFRATAAAPFPRPWSHLCRQARTAGSGRRLAGLGCRCKA
jgi:hypothetical protein